MYMYMYVIHVQTCSRQFSNVFHMLLILGINQGEGMEGRLTYALALLTLVSIEHNSIIEEVFTRIFVPSL